MLKGRVAMLYYAHKTENRFQTVKEHLEATAKLASDNAREEFKSLAYECGLLHDIGKYTYSFQKRLDGSNIKFEHSICGAKFIEENFKKDFFAPLMEACIAGHHSGLPDCVIATADSKHDDAALSLRLKRECEDFSSFKNDIKAERPDTEKLIEILKTAKSRTDFCEIYAFMTKYIFSCLTDADFIDTESFCNPQAQRGIDGDFKGALEKLNTKLNGFCADNEVRLARKNLLEQAYSRSENMEEINILNMPTGSGKTLCSLKIALEKAIKEGKKRIIYVIPYTSIIEQTANVFGDIFGDSLYILQHHSNFDYDKENDPYLTAEKLKKTCENWDAPFIVTTSVQFFQSLYHFKGSRLRKLHNLSDSIIIFDEIHLIPTKLLQPCLRGVGYITKYLNSKAVFLSATMPDYTSLFKQFLPDNKIYELITDKSDFKKFSNCTYTNMGKTSYESVVMKADEYLSSLIIVNSKKSAQEVYKMLDGKKFHLSTYMTPKHRSEIIAKIRECLKNKEKISVVSTSLVEAGVDFDFETVFREIAGLDSILQSGGRCNREGERENGYVYIFDSGCKLEGDLDMRANISKNLLNEYSDITDEICIKDYYGRIFKYSDEDIRKNSIATFIPQEDINPAKLLYRSYAEHFKYIKSDTISIIIDNNETTRSLLERLMIADMSVKRKLQPYSVSLRSEELDEMLKCGLIKKLPCGVLVLSNNDCYDEKIGITKEFHDYFD